MTERPDHIAIVGAGQAGATLAETLRKRGHAGRITLWGEEPEIPYQRPPLSKAYLLGEMDRARLFLRPRSYWDEQGIELRTGTRVTAIDPAAHSLTHDGGTESWGALALTTGSRNRRLPAAMGGDLQGVYGVRTLADIDAMEPAFRAGALCHQELPEPLHVTYRLGINRWRGNVSVQMVVQHLVEGVE